MISGIQSSMAMSQDMMLQRRDDMFAKLDTDGDGSIDLAELSSETATKGTESRRFSKMIEYLIAADTNGDGQVSKEEFDAMEPPPKPPDDERPDFMYGRNAQITESTETVGTLLEMLG